MSSAQPFAPGSPAGGASVALGGGLPPLDFKSSSEAHGQSTSVFDSSGFSVTYGGSVPTWALIVAAAAVGWWAWKRA